MEAVTLSAAFTISVTNHANLMKKDALFLALLAIASSAEAVSFDCAKAISFVEKQICADPLLGRLDDALAQNYRGMLSADFGGSKKALRGDQLKWLAERNRCTNNSCLVRAYRTRVNETCEYGVVSGAHPECTLSDDVK